MCSKQFFLNVTIYSNTWHLCAFFFPQLQRHLIYSRWPWKEVFHTTELKSELNKKFLSINLPKLSMNFPYILQWSLPILTQLSLFLFLLPSFLPSLLSLFYLFLSSCFLDFFFGFQ